MLSLAVTAVLMLTAPLTVAMDEPDLVSMMGLPYFLTLQKQATFHTIYGTTQQRMLALFIPPYGESVPLTGLEFVAEMKDGELTGRTCSDPFPAIDEDSVNKQLECPAICSCPELREKLEIYKQCYLNGKELQPPENVKNTDVITRRLRVFQGRLRVVDEIESRWEGFQYVSRAFIVMEVCTGRLLHISNRLAFDMADYPQRMVPHRQRRTGGNPRNATCPRGTGGNEFLGEINYGGGPDEVCLDVRRRRRRCFLQNDRTAVRDAAEANSSCATAPVISFPCNQGPEDSINGGGSPSLDTMNFLTLINDVMDDWYSAERDSFPRPQACVNYGTDVVNSLWDGRFILVGNGDAHISYPFSTSDVIAHEFGHAITESFSRLLTTGEAGGVDDSFSDMLAKVVEAYVNGGSVNTWDLGLGLLRNHQAIRHMDDPTADGMSIDNANDFTEGLNSHFASGVFNKAFFCMAQDIPIAIAFWPFLGANMVRWNSYVTFREAACDVLQAAYDSGVNTNVVKTCFALRGLPLDDCPLDDALHKLCAAPGQTVTLTVQASEHRNPYFKVCQCSSTYLTVTAPGTTIYISTGDAYTSTVGSLDTATFSGPLLGDVYVRIKGPTDLTTIQVTASFEV